MTWCRHHALPKYTIEWEQRVDSSPYSDNLGAKIKILDWRPIEKVLFQIYSCNKEETAT